MGIELPTPHGEVPHAPSAPGEITPRFSGPEVSVQSQNVENKSTERPAVQEVKNNSGGSGPQQTVQKTDDTTTTDDPSAVLQPAVSLDDIPVIAADDDLIEKQWVESVKRAIKETRDDPYGQSEAINRLQADYLQKRYGKTLGQESA